MKKIGILGGTFDPIHMGHLILAEQAKEEADLDQIIIMPTMIQPFKMNKEIADGDHRYRMVEKAIEGNRKLQVSRQELDTPGISYTIHTLRACREALGETCELFFITGTDAFLDIEKWYQAKELLTEFSFIVGSRPGYKEEELLQYIHQLKETYHTNIIKINNRKVEISSTDIKNRIKHGKSIKYLVTKEVEEYIYDSKLYQ